MKQVLFCFFLIPGVLFSQVTLDWLQFTGGVSITTDAADNVYTVNWVYAAGGDIILTKRDANGNFLWETFFDNTDATRHEVATWVETDNAGNIIVTGTIRSGYASPVNAASVVMKFSPAGTLLWRVVYETSFDGSSTKKCLIDGSNNIYVLGMGTGPTGYVTKVKKFSSAGVPLWSYYNAAGIGAAQNFKFTPDNKLLISGRGTIGSINGYAKIDLDGNEIWSYAGVMSLTIGDAAGDSFGNTYLINGEYVAGTSGSILSKLSTTGSLIWDETNTITGTKVEVGTDNNPVIGGFPGAGTAGVAMMKYDQLGNVIWSNFDADGPLYSLLLHAMMKLDPANNVYFGAGTLFEMAVCKVNADGSNDWVAACSGSYANGFTFGNDYSIFVVGGATAHFTQEPIVVCDAPTGLFTNNILANKARLNWTVEPGAVQYEVWYKKSTAAAWKIRFVPGTSNKLNLKNLQCNKNYVWQIRTICDTAGTDIISAFSSVQNFTTLICREETDKAPYTVSIYPNPATDQFTVNWIMEDNISGAVITVTDFSGRTVYESVIPAEVLTFTETIRSDTFSSGIYFVKFISDDGTDVHPLMITR